MFVLASEVEKQHATGHYGIVDTGRVNTVCLCVQTVCKNQWVVGKPALVLTYTRLFVGVDM